MEVIWCGDSIEWKIFRASFTGVRLSALVVARYVARSLAPHSHSRLERNSKGAGNVSVLIVVSIWKILGPLSLSTLPIRQFEW